MVQAFVSLKLNWSLVIDAFRQVISSIKTNYQYNEANREF